MVGYIGLGTPLGGLGAEFEAMPIRGVSFGAGIGIGSYPLTELSGGDGPQFALMVRARFINKQIGLGLGAGPSEGGYRQTPLDISESTSGVVRRTDEGVWWLNGELFIERRAAAPVWWRIFAGYGREVASFGTTCAGDPEDIEACENQGPRGLPYFGFALGVTLGAAATAHQNGSGIR